MLSWAWKKFYKLGAEWLVLPTSDHEVQGSNPAWGEIHLMTVLRFLHRAFHYHPTIVSMRLK